MRSFRVVFAAERLAGIVQRFIVRIHDFIVRLYRYVIGVVNGWYKWAVIM